MKNIIITFIYCLSLTFAIAQEGEKNVWRVSYMKPKAGMVDQFEKGLKDHVEKHHGSGEWPEYHFRVISGPNFGSYMKFTGPHSWKSFDDRVRSQADINHSKKYLNPYMEWGNSSPAFWVYSEELSYKPSQWKLAHLSYNYTVPGTGNEYIEVLKSNKKVKVANKSNDPHEIYKIVSGQNPDTWVWAYPMEKMEDMSATSGISGGGSGAAEKVLGKSESDRINKIYKKIVKSRMREVIRFRADLSTPAGDN